MKPWPWFLLSLFFRLLVIPIVVVLAMGAASTIVKVYIANLNVVVIVVAVVVINLIVSQFEADSRRMTALEEQIDALRKKPPTRENREPKADC
jgi:hypothetical protein